MVERPLPALRRPARAGTHPPERHGLLGGHPSPGLPGHPPGPSGQLRQPQRGRRAHARGLPHPAGRGRSGGHGHAGDAPVPLPGPARPHPAAGPGVQGLHPQGGRVAPARDRAGGRRAARRRPWSRTRSTCSRPSPTPCPSGSSATSWVCRWRTRTGSKVGRKPWPAASTPTSC